MKWRGYGICRSKNYAKDANGLSVMRGQLSIKKGFLIETLFNRQLKTNDRQPTTILITNGVNPDETQ